MRLWTYTYCACSGQISLPTPRLSLDRFAHHQFENQLLLWQSVSSRHVMASLARGPPPLLKPETGHAPQVHTEAADAGAAARPGSREVKTIPQPPYKGGFGTPTNTPANPPPVAIAPRLGGGRPIGLSPGGGGGAPHAITPGNTPSSLETMGRRIAGKLQGNGCGGQAGGAGAAAGSSSARIAPSYE